MKDFNELNNIEEQEQPKSDGIKDFKELLEENQSLFEQELIQDLSEEEIQKLEATYIALVEHIENGGDLEEIDEGIIGGLLGGAAGALVGPALGKAICKALGIEKGILYDTLTSRLVTAALGASIFGKKR